MKKYQELKAMASELWGAGWEVSDDREEDIGFLMNEDPNGEALTREEAELVYDMMCEMEALSREE